jgi:K+/H+ antiporter YhaU regulatory subunit KhtT
MELRCSIHPLIYATFICKNCGVLCDEHVQEEEAKNHAHVPIDNNIRNLYSAIRNREEAKLYCSVISKLKKVVNSFLEKDLLKFSNQMLQASAVEKQYAFKSNIYDHIQAVANSSTQAKVTNFTANETEKLSSLLTKHRISMSQQASTKIENLLLVSNPKREKALMQIIEKHSKDKINASFKLYQQDDMVNKCIEETYLLKKSRLSISLTINDNGVFAISKAIMDNNLSIQVLGIFNCSARAC